LNNGFGHAMYDSQKKKVVYYPGCFANYWDPLVGRSVVSVLEKNGLDVIVPRHQCCGLSRIGCGDIKGARKDADRLIDILFPLVKKGYDIVTACPSCSLAIKKEYPFFVNNEKSKLVAESTYFLSRYLNELYEKGEIKMDFKRIPLTSVAYHAPCHLKAQNLETDSIKLMALIPGLQIININRGCCGMAGAAGVKHEYYESSMIIGSALFKKIKEINAQIVATDCGACKLQIEQAAAVEVIHPITILDKAWRNYN